MRKKDSAGFGGRRAYFVRGYWYVTLTIGLMNFVAIWYVPYGFDTIFPTIFNFAMIAVPIVLFTGIMLGWLDMTKGTFHKEQEELAKHSPNWQQTFSSLDTINNTVNKICERLDRLEGEKK